ncbi:MAG: PAS domain-containing protein [Dehalococcoidales bacterium]|nr:MAG: PAS domain-containing protein [Dehalococcoidales bacterium]
MSKTRSTSGDLTTSAKKRDFQHLGILALMMVFCSVFYYFGEIIDLTGWEGLRWSFFYSVHDVHRLLFLIPIIYAGYFLGYKATALVTIVAVGTCLPRALFISTFPDPLLRPVLFIIVASVLGYFAARVRDLSKKQHRSKVLLNNKIDRLSAILEGIGIGVLIIGPDYSIRFYNRNLIRDFGEVTKSHCYEYLHGLDAPCHPVCKLSDVINGAVERWEYVFPDGRTFEISASPHIDSDGVTCQLSVLRDITRYRKGDAEPAGPTN